MVDALTIRNAASVFAPKLDNRLKRLIHSMVENIRKAKKLYKIYNAVLDNATSEDEEKIRKYLELKMKLFTPTKEHLMLKYIKKSLSNAVHDSDSEEEDKSLINAYAKLLGNTKKIT